MNFQRKIKKAIQIAQHTWGQKELKTKVNQFNNPILTLVFNSLLQLKNEEFDEADLKVFEEINLYRSRLSRNDEIVDYSVFESGKIDLVKHVYQRAASPEIWCKLHYLLAKNFNSKNYLEIGTNLGVSGSYILSALKKDPHAKFISLEGVPKLVEVSTQQFKRIVNPSQFEILEGLYDSTFPQMLEKNIQFDMAFIDGNHKYEPTLYYFQEIKKKITDKAILIFDDIYTSDEMVKLWKEVQKDADVNYILDLYKLGIVILDKSDLEKKHYMKGFLAL